MENQKFTVKEISKAFGVDEGTVRRWIRSGKLKANKDSNKKGYLVTKEDLGEFVKRSNRKKYRMSYMFIGRRITLIGAIAPILTAGMAYVLNEKTDKEMIEIKKKVVRKLR